MTQQADDDLKEEFKEEGDDLWGEWTENPDTEEEGANQKNLDDFYSKDDE